MHEERLGNLYIADIFLWVKIKALPSYNKLPFNSLFLRNVFLKQVINPWFVIFLCFSNLPLTA